MKITKSKLKQIIKEELGKVLKEAQNESFTVFVDVVGNKVGATFQFAGAGDTYAYTTSGTFTMSDGTTLEAQDKTLFKF